ncbi:AAA family ATPase [Microbacterium sp. NPDC055910]|uniref:AAA family ATPase n=1 Tax=Microbacterium sp. NPDC055910 TaxID=3345659 RepID=UPI0035DFE80D
MRGGLERWKRGVESHGVRQAISYALKGTCDSHLRATTGADALTAYGDAGAVGVSRFVVEDGAISMDLLDESALRRWVDGCDPVLGERRGRDLQLPSADLLLDGTINAPKSFSVAAVLDADLAVEFEALQDRLRDRIILTWQRELNARRGAGGRIREDLARVEVVELQHRRSRALDPHIHRHLWLNVKVQGRDGQWSNVDSRVAMKLHTLINAEGELAARTDPTWLAALARHGFTLDGAGEIAELSHAVRPLSRRSTQIEANRAMLLSQWREEHPGENPSVDVIQQVDRLAWAMGRPQKPHDIDEAEWERLIRDELTAIDRRILIPRPPVRMRATRIKELNLELLAATAIVEADDRSTATGGRFSLLDVRAGALRALAASGVIADRDELDPVADRIVDLALTHTIDLLDGAAAPDHVKALMATATAVLKVDLAARLERITRSGTRCTHQEIARIADTVLPDAVSLNAEQAEAAGEIAGTDRLVTITGPAGTGKTTMLRVAMAALMDQGRRMVVVAPTKKAATVAGTEIGATASSLHALLADHGWRWGTDPAGAQSWTRLERGDPDPARPGVIYEGPRRYLLRAGDRIVVDEAGMVDLQTANALADVVASTGAGIVMVGDDLQATPVGHAGAMAIATRCATATVELSAVHRFHDQDYAALTLRMRRPTSADDALDIACALHGGGHVRLAPDEATAREAMVDAYFRHSAKKQRVALVTGTNDEAAAVNEAIQERRVTDGDLSARRLAVGQGEQRLLEGDVVQTRRNDHRTDVENRALWRISRITSDNLELVSVHHSGMTRTVDRAYAAEHVHLAYASTVHGIQGETADVSIVGPGVNAAGLYVGMTRGRYVNEAILISHHRDAALDALASTMLRGTPEVTIDESRRAAHSELHRAAHPPQGPGASPHAPDHSSENDGLNHLASLDRWIAEATRGLQHLDARAASADAAGHARGPSAPLAVGTRRARLAERLHARRVQRDRIAQEMAPLHAREPAYATVAVSAPLHTPAAPSESHGLSR